MEKNHVLHELYYIMGHRTYSYINTPRSWVSYENKYIVNPKNNSSVNRYTKPQYFREKNTLSVGIVDIWPWIHNMVVVTSPIGVHAPPAFAAMTITAPSSLFHVIRYDKWSYSWWENKRVHNKLVESRDRHTSTYVEIQVPGEKPRYIVLIIF